MNIEHIEEQSYSSHIEPIISEISPMSSYVTPVLIEVPIPNIANKRVALQSIDSDIPVSVKKRKVGRPPLAEKTLVFEKENMIFYCICKDVDYGEMVLCDGQNCKI